MNELVAIQTEAWSVLKVALRELSRILEEGREDQTRDELVARYFDPDPAAELHGLPDEWLYEEQREHVDFYDGKWPHSSRADTPRSRRREALFEQLRDAVAERDERQTAALFRSLQDAIASSRLSYDAQVWEAVDEALEILGASEPVLIFAPPAPAIQVPKLIVSVEEALVEAIQREPASIFRIPSRAFEELVAGVFRRKGFETELTKATRDGGRDIIAIHEVLGIRAKYIIECKRYAEHRKVSLELVQRLYGVKMAEAANKAILATTSSFTRDATAFASHHLWDLELKSFEDIMQWIREYRSPA